MLHSLTWFKYHIKLISLRMYVNVGSRVCWTRPLIMGYSRICVNITRNYELKYQLESEITIAHTHTLDFKPKTSLQT